MYSIMYEVTLNTKHWNLFPLVFQCLEMMFLSYQNKSIVNIDRLSAFVKRLVNMSTQLPSHWSLACLHTARKMIRSDPRVYNMLNYEGGCDKDFNPFQPTQETSFAPHRIFNIGGNSPIELFSFIEIIERFFNKKAILNLCELPDGDVISTAADTQALEKWIGFKPKISIHEGMDLFLKWFKEYY